MAKVFRLKANCPTFWEGDLAVLRDDGNLYWIGNPDPEKNKIEREKHWADNVIMFNSKTLKNFEILKNWFEEVNPDLVRSVWPFEGAEYWYVGSTGVKKRIWYGLTDDETRKQTNNIFLDKEDAEKAWQNLRSLVVLKNLGTEMTTFTVLQQGEVHITAKYYPEFFEKEKETLTDLLKRCKNEKDN